MARRRANGEGTIYRRKDGRYEAAAYFLTTTGTRKRHRVYGKTREEVAEQLTEAKGKAQRGVPLPDRTWRLSEYIDYWLEDVVLTNRRPKTYQQYESVSRLYLKPALGKKRLTDLSVPLTQAFLNGQLKEARSHGHSMRKVHAMRVVLSAVLSRAEREELVTRNVARLVELPSWEPKDVHPWTVDEASRFLAAAKQDPLYPAFALLLLYGLRRGEVLGLRWCDVDFEASVIHIRQQLQRVGSVLHIGPVKTRAGRRDLPMLDLARRALIDLRPAQQQANANLSKPAEAGNGLVFTMRSGKPLDPDAFYRSFLRLCRAQDVRRIKVHHIRHTTATLLKKLGVPARDTQLILGHSQISVTQQIYQHDDTESRRDALTRIENLLTGPGTDEKNDRCRQNSRQKSFFYARQRPSGLPNRLRFGAGRGSRTPEDISRLIYSPTDDSLTDRAQSVKMVAGRWAQQWIIGVAAVKFSRQTSTGDASSQGQYI